MESIETLLHQAGYSFIGNTKEIIVLIESILKTKNERLLKSIPFLLYKYPLSASELEFLLQNKVFQEIYEITQRIFTKQKIPIVLKKHFPVKKLSFEDFYFDFLTQYKKDVSRFDLQSVQKQRNQSFWMSYIFTPKEREIIQNILLENPLSKTEYEYFSRKTKKKCKAILQLQDVAQILSERNPKLK